MRNTMMRDKLADAFTTDGTELSSSRTNEEILSTVSAVQRKLRKDERKPHGASAPGSSFAGSKRPSFGSISPRYITPPNRLNPFSVHAHPVSAFLTVDKDQPAATVDSKLGVEAAKPLISPPLIEPSSQESPHLERQIFLSGDASSVPAAIPVPPPFPQAQTAFSPELIGMVTRLRTAKSAIAFTLEQLRGRRKKTEEELTAKQHDLEGIDRQMEHERENLRKIEDTITASTLLAEQAAAIDPGLLTSRGTHHKTAGGGGDGKRYANRWSDDPSILHIADMRSFFAEHPDPPPHEDGWSVATIVLQLPAIKQAHAKTALPGMLKGMADAGLIERVGRGLYKAVSK